MSDRTRKKLVDRLRRWLIPQEDQSLSAAEQPLTETTKAPPALSELNALLTALRPGPLADRDAEHILELIAALDKCGLPQDAEGQLRLAERRHRHGMLGVALVKRLLSSKRLAEAQQVADGIRGDSYEQRVLTMLGDVYYREGNLLEAQRTYESALAIDYQSTNVRQRVDELRQQLRASPPSAAPTILSADDAKVHNSYLLRRVLGIGGGGTIYLATDRALGRPVALKVLHENVAATVRLTLLGEARLAATLVDPRVLRIYDIDQENSSIVMEYCPGGSLRDLLRLRQPAVDWGLQLIVGILEALQVVHRAQVVHGDLKPSNIFFRNDPTDERHPPPPVIGDFGSAHAVWTSRSHSPVAGTQRYMAPEVCRGQQPSPAADLYACGVMLLEVLCGPLEQQPATDLARLLGQSQAASQIPKAELAALEEMLAQWLAADAERRGSAVAAAQALGAVVLRLRQRELHCALHERLRAGFGSTPPSWLAAVEPADEAS